MEDETEGRDAAGEVSIEIGCSAAREGSVNEDALPRRRGPPAVGVFDGLGATAQGAEAAGLAAEAVRPPTTSTATATTAQPSERSDSWPCGAPAQLIAATLEDGLTTASVVKAVQRQRWRGDGPHATLVTAGCTAARPRAGLHQCTLTTPPSVRTGSSSPASARSPCRRVWSSTPTSSDAT